MKPVMDTLVFWILAGTAVVSALAVVVLRNPMNSVVALLVTLLVTAGLYLQMGAFVIALFQVILYVGAVLVLFLFVIMTLDLKSSRERPVLSPGGLAAAVTASVLFIAGAGWFASRGGFFPGTAVSPGVPGNGPEIREIALDLFTGHLLVFELASVLLLAAAVAALVIVRKERSRP